MKAGRHIDREEEQLTFWRIDNPPPQTKKNPTKRRSKPVSVTERREQNLKYLVDTRYDRSVESLAQTVKLPSRQLIAAYRGGDGKGVLNHRMARCIEFECGLDTGWLDRIHADAALISAKLSSLDTESRLIIEKVVDAFLAGSKHR